MAYELDASHGLPAELKASLRTQGFVLLRQYLKHDDLRPLIDSLKDVVKTFLRQAGLQTELSSEIDRDMVRLIKAKPKWQAHFYDRLQMTPAALAFPATPRMTELARAALDTETIGVWPRMQIRLDLPDDEKNLIEWHHDYSYNKGTADSYTIWLPLVSISSVMGPIQAALGTHRQDFTFIDSDKDRRHNQTLPESIVRGLKTVQPERMNLGDMMIFHSKLIHTGMINRDLTRARLVAVFRVQDLNRLDLFREGKA